MITDALNRRPYREPDSWSEHQALLTLAEVMEDPQAMLQTLVEMVIQVSRADSAGISVLEPGTSDPLDIRWHAIAGEHAMNTNQIMSRENSPCGLVMATQTIMLFDRPQRHFPVFARTQPPPVECLIIPFYCDGVPVGTLWGFTSQEGNHFDAEDARILRDLSRFASVGFRSLQARDAATARQREIEERVQQRTAELTAANVALREIEQRFRRATAIESVGLITFTTDGEITWANDSFLNMSGYNRDDLNAGRIRWDIMTPDEWIPHSHNAIRELTERGNTTPYEKVYIRKDGSRWWGLFAATRLSEHEGVEYIIDITESKETEARLAASEERFRALVNATSDVVYRMSPDWSEMYELHGHGFIHDTTEPKRAWLEEYIHPSDQPQVTAAIQEAIQTKSVFLLEHRVRHVDGSLGWTLSRAVPVLDENGEITAWFGAASDVTARRRAEEALRENERELSDRVEKATAELRSLSRELLRVQEAERRHLAHELHDEIGQSLTGLTFSLEMAKRSDRKEHLEHAEHITQSLLEQVRALSLQLRPSVLDDMGLIPALLELTDRVPARTGVRVDLYHEGADRRFPTDIETVAYRVVQEALTNVARHSETDRATVRVVASDRLTIRISDEGQGFDIDAARANGTYSGLAGMQERASLVGGNVSLDSATGEGTTITLELPLTPDDSRSRGD